MFGHVDRPQQRKTLGKRKATRTAQAAEPAPAEAAPKPARRSSQHELEILELQIDECLDLAKSLDREGLQDVILLLRRSRNEVIWKLAEA